jgi:hypothetical protein
MTMMTTTIRALRTTMKTATNCCNRFYHGTSNHDKPPLMEESIHVFEAFLLYLYWISAE